MRRQPSGLWMVINRGQCDEGFDSAKQSIRSQYLFPLPIFASRTPSLELSSPHFSRPVRNAHGVPTFVGASREGFRPGKLLPKQLATGDLLTS